MKKCSKCGETKQVAEFNKDAQKRDGICSHCKACEKARATKRRADHPDKKRVGDARYYAANREKIAARAAAYYAANRERLKTYAAKYRADHPEKARTAIAKWAAANPEKHRSYRARYIASNPDADRIRKHARRAREAGGKPSKDIAERLYALQRGKCACCKQPLGNDYHLDHIMPLALGGTNTDDNIQLLRAKCNLQKSAKHPIDYMRENGFLC